MKPAWRSIAVALVLCGSVFAQTAPSPSPQSSAAQPLTTPSPAAQSGSADFDQELAAGRQAHAAGDDRAAAAHFDRALGLSTPGQQRASALLYLGVVFAGGQRLSDAETAFRAAVLANPQCTECGFNLGFVLLKESKDAEGVAALKSVLPQLQGTAREREVERFIADPARARKDFAPEFSAKAASGEPVNLDALRGKVVLLDFWGAWCAPCRQTVPLLKQLAQGVDPSKVAIVSVDEHDSRETWTQFVAKNGMSWTQVHDDDGSLQRAFGVDGFPTSVLLSKDGIILQKFKGWGPGWEPVMRGEIEKALKNNN
jgi:thiol-disulfide isomerase/thioredoxin